jgi:hypothetical protein
MPHAMRRYTSQSRLIIEVAWQRFALLILFMTSLTIGASCSPDRNAGSFVRLGEVSASYLTINGKVVHPGCVNELIGSIADPFPVVAAVDVEGIRRSNEYRIEATVEKDGWVHYEDEEVLGKNARLSYKLLGIMPQQVYVLEVYDVTGASAIFGWILFAKIEKDFFTQSTVERRERTTLKSVGYVGLGDRNHPAVELHEGRLAIGPSEGYPKGLVVSIAADGEVKVEIP